jgi:3-phenylpropionate/cinnamic acid dioxygenase small subunit
VSAVATATASELEQFVYDEARLIDEKRFDEWYELFTDDGRYWMPLTRGQPDGENHTSLFYEDKLLLKVRIERLKSPRSFSQAQPSWCQHVLQRPQIVDDGTTDGRIRMHTPFVYVESRLDTQLVLAGTATHRLRRERGALRIELKKVELTNCDAALPSIQLFP